MRRLGRFLFVPVDHPLRHALLRHPAKSHPGRRGGRRKRHDYRPAHSRSERPGQGGGDSIGAAIVSDHRPDCAFGNAIWDREMLALSKHPYAINPNPNLKEIALANGWTVYQPEANHG
jgi:hypothetical protein